MSTNAYRSSDESNVTGPVRSAKVLLAVGFVALTAAIVAAYSTPPDGYEVSLYTATPTVFWAGVAVAVACAFACAFLAADRRLAGTGLVLGSLAVLAIAALPLLRGYRYFGAGDALSHLGWVSQIVEGEYLLRTLLYPGVHGLSALVHAATGAALPRSMLVVVFLFSVVFVAFVPLAVRAVTGQLAAATLGTASALFFLPVNNISVHLQPHPSTMAILFVPVALFALVHVLEEPARTSVGPYGLLLAVVSVGLVLVHPQQATNFLLVLGALAGVKLVAGRWFPPARNIGPVYGQTAFLAAVLVLWSLPHERIAEFVMGASEALLTAGGSPGIAQRTGSLSDIGVSVAEIFVKLFFANAVYLALAGVLVLVVLYRSRSRVDRETRTVFALGVGLVPVGALFLLYLAGGIQQMAFRQLGFVMSVVAVLGSVALYRSLAGAWRRGGTGARVWSTLAVVALALLLVLSLMSLFPSPYMYKPNEHVSEQQLAGYDTAFAAKDPDVKVLGIRKAPIRYEDAVRGTGELVVGPQATAGRVPADLLDGGLTGAYPDPRYVAVTEADVQREAVAFRELRYSREEMTSVGAYPGVDHVQTNGGFDLYYVTSE